MHQKLLRAPASVRHAIFQHQVGEVPIAQKIRFLPPEFQNALDDWTVVVFVRNRAIHVCFVNLAADSCVIQIGHQRDIARGLQCESP